MTLRDLFLQLGQLLAAGEPGTTPVFVQSSDKPSDMVFPYACLRTRAETLGNAREILLEFGHAPARAKEPMLEGESPTAGALVRDMSLRDLFAASALQGALATRRATEDIGPLCYDIADAMLRAREAE